MTSRASLDKAATREGLRGWERPGQHRPARRWWWAAGLAVALLAGVGLSVTDGGGGLPMDEAAEPGEEAGEEAGGETSLGERWTSYASLDNAVSVVPTPDGHVWVATRAAGLLRWDADGESYEHYPYDELPGYPRSLAAGEGGAVWAVVGDGVARFDGDEWRKAPVEVRDDALATDGGTVWVAAGTTLWRFDGQSWEELDGPGRRCGGRISRRRSTPTVTCG